MKTADTESQKSWLFRFEDVEVGEKSSRASGFVFLLLCLIPAISTILFGGVDAGTWIIILVLTGAIGLTWILDALLRKGFPINRSVLLLPVAGLIVIGLIQLLPLFASDIPVELLPGQSRQPLSMDPYSTRFFVIRLAVYFIFLAAALTYLNTERRLKKLTFVTILLTATVSFFGILQWLAKPDAIYGVRETPNAVPFGPFVNQHHFAAFTVLGCGLALGLLTDRSGKRDKILLLAVAALMMVVGALLTGSRGGVLGYAGMLAFVLVTRFWLGSKNGESKEPRRPAQIMVMAGVAVAAVLIVVSVVIFVGGDTSLMRVVGVGAGGTPADASNGRIHFWTTALKIFADHPILGVGYDSFGVAFTRYDTWNGIFRVEQAHNDYLQTLADAGIAGFICVAGFIALLFKKGLSVIKSSADPMRSSIAVGALAGCVGILIHSFFDFPLRTPSNTFSFLLLAALATVTVKAAETPRSKRS